jgi:hypothetical protein
MFMKTLPLIRVLVLPMVMLGALGAAPLTGETMPAAQPADMTLQSVKIQGSLDLDNGVPIRWKKPDGSGYVNIFTVDKNGTLQLCHDPFYFEQPIPDKKTKPKDAQEKQERARLEELHSNLRVIEVRNPNTAYPDLRLPITRSQGSDDIRDCDSKLTVRSANFVETNDPAELNLVRTGNDNVPVNDENAPVKDGSITGIVRFMGRCSPARDSQHSGIGTDAEIIARNYGTNEKDHWGGMFFLVKDNNIPNATDSSGVMAMVQSGVRIGHMARSPGEGRTGSILEVDCDDSRPVIFRHSRASTTQPVMLALAAGKNGTAADAENSLALIKASPVGSGPMNSRLEIQTNKGNRLESEWVLPVPAAQASSDGAQQIPSGEVVTLALNHNRYDTDSMREAGQATRLTCRTAGRYAISVALEFSANGKGNRQVIVRRNGREQVASMRVAAAQGETTQITFTAPLVELKPGDYVELLVRQNSGQQLEVPANGEQPPTFTMARVG